MNESATEQTITDQIFQDLNYPAKGKSQGLSNAYVRSCVFTAQTGLNSLVTAAQPILSFLDRLQRSEAMPAPEVIHENLTHELQAFEAHAVSFEYQEDLIAAARFILCVTLDDILSRAHWPEDTSWDSFKLIPFDQDTKPLPEEGFFIILERVKETPEIYIDLLELIYLCLGHGFQGKYRHLSDGKQQLDDILDALYEIIREQRGDADEQIFLSVSGLPLKKATPMGRRLTYLVLFIICLITSVYFSFNYILNISSQPLLDKIQTVSQQLQLKNDAL